MSKLASRYYNAGITVLNEVVYDMLLNVAFEFVQLYRSTDTVGNLTNAFRVILWVKGVASTQ
jgi:hypothetical protein